jgi:hypothetical protein
MGLALCRLLSVVHPLLWCSPLYFKRSLFPAYFAASYIVSLQCVYNYVTVLMLSGHLPYSFWCYWQFRKKLCVFAFFFMYVHCLATNLSLHHCVCKFLFLISSYIFILLCMMSLQICYFHIDIHLPFGFFVLHSFKFKVIFSILSSNISMPTYAFIY